MNRLYKHVSTLCLLLIMSFFVVSPLVAKSKDANNIVRSIWKYEQDQTKYSPEDGVAKKIYFLSLNSDGTYHQYVQVVPISPQDYFRVKNYSMDGKWSEKGGKLILNEYGKENAIDYTYIYSKFENIDNQILTAKE